MRPDLVSYNIKSARAASGLTQEEVALRAGMQPAVYSRIERGEVDLRVSSLFKIAAALEVSVSDLTSETAFS